jgi:hypothetical protein
VIWLIQNLDPKMLEKARYGAKDDTQVRLTAAKQQIQDLERQVSKLTRLTLNDDDPSPSLVGELKNHESQLRVARTGLETLELAAAKTHAIPIMPDEDELTRPETRRALRKQIAQWCKKVELFEAHLVVWFSDRNGIKVNLSGDPVAQYHDLDEEEFHEQNQLAEERAIEQREFKARLIAC